MESPRPLERFERGTRSVLWGAVAFACIFVPVTHFLRQREEDKAIVALRDELRQAEAKALEIAANEKKRERIALSMMGPYMSALNYSEAEANLYFSNPFDRTGVLCVIATAKSPENLTTESLAACHDVTPYASGVRLAAMFAGGDLRRVCPKSNCDISFRDAN